MALITKDEVKALLQIGDTSLDTFIDTIIPIVQDTIDQLLKNANRYEDYLNEAGTEIVYPASFKLPAVQIIGSISDKTNASGAKSFSLGDFSITYNTVKELTTESFKTLIKPKLVFY